MRLIHQTWQQVEIYLETRTGIIIPCGSTEQHGPMGMIGTDAICAEAAADHAATATGALIAPTLNLGQAQFNLAYPGTISLRAETLMAVVRDVVSSLASQGFTHFYFLNGHGGNVAPLQSAFQDLYRDTDPPIRCRIRSWWDHAPVADFVAETFGDSEGLHATPSEISITQAVLHAVGADAVRPADVTTLDPAFVRDHRGDNHFDRQSHRERFPDGRIGSDSWLASAEIGRRVLNLASAAIAEDFRTFLSE